MLKLSKRLEWIAEQVPAGSRLADIGSDHALLPAYLAQQGRIVKGIAGEVNRGPFQAASKQIREAGLERTVDVRLGDGLAVIAPGEADVITIAGMGGALISAILEAGQAKLAGVKLLVLQPNVGEENVRSWLLAHEWTLLKELILEEDGKIYEILVAASAQPAEASNDRLYAPRLLNGPNGGLEIGRELLLKMGPYLLQAQDEVWFRKWELEIAKLEMIERQLALSSQPEARLKERELELEKKRIKEVLTCLQKDKTSSN
ncbi:class I SAM-dependent methyltransferase [Paenibacillus doosanensis]|uniref:tRNA (Adenine(22)-N(1))-methyltransferase n=1 Tax=Paenibacillus konkukensis TaxID=2020716 RepID=A0ABY4RXI5_9BACL|nr:MULTISPECIES: class I SAM-dependent methyltransferase [Paenibacillus]MCS7463452.1 class I SAM-dependent methyltransferase [Paenibacillus doosanensis]UQZ87012.1 tRNA (adenine(22)-N(1))-methyltransferase [Paenibacillus konkukensis]